MNTASVPASGLRAKALAAHADAELRRQQQVANANRECWQNDVRMLSNLVVTRLECDTFRVLEPDGFRLPVDAVVESDDGVQISLNKGGASSRTFYVVTVCPRCEQPSDNGALVDGLDGLGAYLAGARDICLSCFDNLTDADMLAEVLEGRR